MAAVLTAGERHEQFALDALMDSFAIGLLAINHRQSMGQPLEYTHL